MINKAAKPAAGKARGVRKAVALALFIVAAYSVVRYTPARELIQPEVLGAHIEAAGFWAPLIFMAVYTAGICLFVPGTLLTAVGAALFGPYWGFLYVWIGAFWIGRTLGRDFAASVIGDRLRKYDDAIERNGFATVLYLRLVYFPFTPMNFGMGLTKVRFRDYVAGTGLGILVGTFIFTFFFGTLKEIWAAGDWGRLLSAKVLFSIGLFVFSFFIPKIVKKIRKED